MERKVNPVAEINKETEDIENMEDINTSEDIEKEENELCDETENTENSEDTQQEASDTKKDAKDIIIEELTDKYKRTFAEFDNFRKRSEKEKSAMFELGAKSIIEKILPVIDNFERGFQTVDEEDKEDAFVVGMDKVYKQMVSTLEEAGVKAIDAVGQKFDPNFHNAVMHIEDDNFGENEIAEEFQKGYTYRESVVRHSMVKVAN